ncbi:unnamed protein product, partial [Ectocarpus fasciculatus]
MFLFCFFGLQASYLTWGFMQELVMTTQFRPTTRTPDGYFPSSAFCVFTNRVAAMLVAWVVCVKYRGGVTGAAPMTAFLPCSLSNTMSSWSQYASLKYVSFPMQSIFKSAKVIPVMIMGKVVQNITYSMVEYGEACMITAGVFLFSLQQGSEHMHDKSNFYGVLLLLGYICSDSFTSQYQSSIYKKYGKVDQYHMMFGVNMWSTLMSLASILLAGEVLTIVEFMQENPVSFTYNLISAICGTTGQFFIYTTIKEFGPVTFTIIMTTRQMLSMVFSTVYFGHSMDTTSVLAVILVFGTVFYSVKRRKDASMAKE